MMAKTEQNPARVQPAGITLQYSVRVFLSESLMSEVARGKRRVRHVAIGLGVLVIVACGIGLGVAWSRSLPIP